MTTVPLSRRAASPEGPNAIARARSEATAAGVDLLDLSDSNPTRHGLLHPGVLPAVARHTADAARYDPDPRGHHPAREALAARYGGHPDRYWLTSSTSEAYSWLLTLLADPSQQVAVPQPGYPLVEPLARLAGVRAVGYRLHYVHSQGWLLDPESLTRATNDPATRAVVAVNPGNPTGAYVGDDADRLVQACVAGQSALIADEVFAPFALERAGGSLAGEVRVPTFTLAGLSKLLCAPQLKLAWIRLDGPPAECAALADGLDTIADAFLPVGGPVAAALPDLLALADDAVEATRERLRTNLAATHREFAAGPYRVRRCEGGWTVLVDVPRYLPPEDLAVHLVRRAHLAVHPGWFYDLARDNALALSLLPEPARFTAGLRRLREAIEDLAR